MELQLNEPLKTKLKSPWTIAAVLCTGVACYVGARMIRAAKDRKNGGFDTKQKPSQHPV